MFGTSFIVLSAIAVRWTLIREPIRTDEGATFLRYVHYPLRFIATTYDDPNNHIFHSMIQHVFYKLMGVSEISLRMSPFISGIATILLTGWLARRVTKDVRVMSLSSIFCSVATAMVMYSVNGRGYMFQAFLAVVLTGLTLGLSDGSLKWNVRHLTLLILFCFLDVYSIPTGGLLVASLLLFLFLESSNQRRPAVIAVSLMIGVLLAVAFIPLLGQAGWHLRPPKEAPLDAIVNQMSHVAKYSSMGLMPSILFVLFVVIGLIFHFDRYGKFILYTYATILTASIIFTTPFYPRSFIWLYPLLYVAAARGILRVWDHLQKTRRWRMMNKNIVLLTVLVSFCFFIHRWLWTPGKYYQLAPYQVDPLLYGMMLEPREQIRTIVRALSRRLTTQDRVIGFGVEDIVDFYTLEQRGFNRLIGLGYTTPEVNTIWLVAQPGEERIFYETYVDKSHWAPPQDCSKRGFVRIYRCKKQPTYKPSTIVTHPPF